MMKNPILPLQQQQKQASDKSNTTKSSVSKPPPVVAEHLLVPLLARRSCHLPGYTWRQDWQQWFHNNHILFGICLHHPQHPLEWWERTLALCASISYGFLATFGLLYYWQVVVWNNNTNANNDDDNVDAAQRPDQEVLFTINNYVITRGMVLLWTFGSLLHGLFDNVLIWNVMACACCQPGGRFGCLGRTCCACCPNMGSYILIPMIVGMTGCAIYLVLLYASHNNVVTDMNYGNDDDAAYYDRNNNNYYDAQASNYNAQNDNDTDDAWTVNFNNIQGLQAFSFLTDYAIELVLAWCVYFPVIGTIFFSGCLACCGRVNVPVLGGRPKDVRLVQQDSELARYERM